MKAHSIAYRVTKAECLDLPDQTFTDIPVQLEPSERKLYDQLRKTSIAEIESGEVTAPTVLTRILRLQQFTGGYLIADDGKKAEQVSTAKLSTLSDLLDDYVVENGEKVVIFARFRAELSAIGDLLEAKKIKYGVIHGDVPQDERAGVVDQFQTDPETKVFLAQIQTAGLGITLHAASIEIFYSWDYNYATYEQAVARIHRIGQKRPCTYLHLVCEKTIDKKVLDALKHKKDLAAGIVDNWREVFEDDF
jgi:SNF2 family DNA or RNA helicase